MNTLTELLPVTFPSIISSFLVHSGGFASECVGERCAESYKGYGSNLFSQPNQATKNISQIPHHDNKQAYHCQGDKEARPSTSHPSRGDYGEYYFEWEIEQMHDVVSH